jgi:hypothetical protein
MGVNGMKPHRRGHSLNIHKPLSLTNGYDRPEQMLQNGLFSQAKTPPPGMAERLQAKVFGRLKNVSQGG